MERLTNLLVVLAGWFGTVGRWARSSSLQATVGQVIATALITKGFSDIYPPIAWIFVGLMVLWVSIRLE